MITDFRYNYTSLSLPNGLGNLQLGNSVPRCFSSPRGGEGPRSGVEGDSCANNMNFNCSFDLAASSDPLGHLLPHGEKEDSGLLNSNLNLEFVCTAGAK